MGLSKKHEKNIYKLENELLQPQTRSSADKISSLLSDDFFEFCSSGRIYHYASEDTFDDNGSAYRMEDFKAQRLSNGCILATYRAIKKHSSGAVTESLRSSVWKRRRGVWKMVFHQGTPITE